VNNIRRATAIEQNALETRLRGDFASAESLYQEALQKLADIPNDQLRSRLFTALAEMVEAQGRDAAALRKLAAIYGPDKQDSK